MMSEFPHRKDVVAPTPQNLPLLSPALRRVLLVLALAGCSRAEPVRVIDPENVVDPSAEELAGEEISESAGFTEVTEANAHEYLTPQKLTIVYLKADWCDPCKQYGPVLKQLEDSLGGQIQVVVIQDDDNKKISLRDSFGLDQPAFPSVSIRRAGQTPETIYNSQPRGILLIELKDAGLEIDKDVYQQALLEDLDVEESNPASLLINAHRYVEDDFLDAEKIVRKGVKGVKNYPGLTDEDLVGLILFNAAGFIQTEWGKRIIRETKQDYTSVFDQVIEKIRTSNSELAQDLLEITR